MRSISLLFCQWGMAVGLALVTAWPVQAQLAGRKLGACAERVFLSRDQVTLAAAMATVGAANLERTFGDMRGDDVIAGQMRSCARTIPYHICTDGMLMGLLDPKDALTGGIAGAVVNGASGGPSLLGGLLSAGVVGMVGGTVKTAQCTKRLKMLEPAAAAAFSNWRIDVASGQAGEVRNRLQAALRSRRISAEDANALLELVSATSDRLTR